MAQTALQKAIQQLQSKIAISKQDMEYYRQTIQMDSVRTEHDIQTGLFQSIQILTDLLPYERETIEAAYIEGDTDGSSETMGGMGNRNNRGYQDYFTKTYTN
jgi:phage shock protein A